MSKYVKGGKKRRTGCRSGPGMRGGGGGGGFRI